MLLLVFSSNNCCTIYIFSLISCYLGIMLPKKKRVANSNREEPIVNLQRLTKAKVDTKAKVT